MLRLLDTGQIIPWMFVLSDQPRSPWRVGRDARIVSPGPTTISFLGYVKDISVDLATNKPTLATLDIQLVGQVLWELPDAPEVEK